MRYFLLYTLLFSGHIFSASPPPELNQPMPSALSILRNMKNLSESDQTIGIDFLRQFIDDGSRAELHQPTQRGQTLAGLCAESPLTTNLLFPLLRHRNPRNDMTLWTDEDYFVLVRFLIVNFRSFNTDQQVEAWNFLRRFIGDGSRERLHTTVYTIRDRDFSLLQLFQRLEIRLLRMNSPLLLNQTKPASSTGACLGAPAARSS